MSSSKLPALGVISATPFIIGLPTIGLVFVSMATAYFIKTKIVEDKK